MVNISLASVLIRPIFHAIVAPALLVSLLGASGVLPAVLWVALAGVVYGSGRGDHVRGSVFFFVLKSAAFAAGALTLWVIVFGFVGAISAVGGAM